MAVRPQPRWLSRGHRGWLIAKEIPDRLRMLAMDQKALTQTSLPAFNIPVLPHGPERTFESGIIACQSRMTGHGTGNFP
jgi:hypothetical protein